MLTLLFDALYLGFAVAAEAVQLCVILGGDLVGEPDAAEAAGAEQSAADVVARRVSALRHVGRHEGGLTEGLVTLPIAAVAALRQFRYGLLFGARRRLGLRHGIGKLDLQRGQPAAHLAVQGCQLVCVRCSHLLHLLEQGGVLSGAGCSLLALLIVPLQQIFMVVNQALMPLRELVGALLLLLLLLLCSLELHRSDGIARSSTVAQVALSLLLRLLHGRCQPCVLSVLGCLRSSQAAVLLGLPGGLEGHPLAQGPF